MEPNNIPNTPPAPQNISPVSQPTFTPNPMSQNNQPSMPPKPSSSAGSITALIVILALLILGAFYFWSERSGNETSESDNAALESINSQSNSDLEADIEADLNSTDVDGVDYDLDEANFNAS